MYCTFSEQSWKGLFQRCMGWGRVGDNIFEKWGRDGRGLCRGWICPSLGTKNTQQRPKKSQNGRSIPLDRTPKPPKMDSPPPKYEGGGA